MPYIHRGVRRSPSALADCGVRGLQGYGQGLAFRPNFWRVRRRRADGKVRWRSGHRSNFADWETASDQLAAFFTSAAIFASAAAVNSFRANDVGHIAPSSSLAWSLKPNVAYLDLNLSLLWKKHTTLPSWLA